MSTRFNPFGRFLCCMVPNCIARQKELSQGAKLLLGRLVQFNGRGNRCNPREKILAAELGISERTCRRYICELVRWKLIEVQQNGLRRANSYHFLEHPWLVYDRQDKNGRLERSKLSSLERPRVSGPSGRESEEGDSIEVNPCSPLPGDEGSSTRDVVPLSQVEEIYGLYPKPARKPSALRAIRQCIQQFGFETVRDRTRDYAACVGGSDLRFVPFPTRFFREQRFNDPPETWKRVAPSTANVHDNKPEQYSGGSVIL